MAEEVGAFSKKTSSFQPRVQKAQDVFREASGSPAHTQSSRWAGMIPRPANLRRQTRIFTRVRTLTRDRCPEKQVREEKGSGEGRLAPARSGAGIRVRRARGPAGPSVLATDCDPGAER